MVDPLALRQGVAALSARARRDLFTLWDRLSTTADIEAALRDVLPTLIDQYGLAAAALAADWYDDLRAEADAPGRFRAIPADVPETGAQALVGWAVTEAQDDAGFKALIEGGTQRRIANFSRLTVAQSTAADPQAAGWKRIGHGACPFCRMLIQRDQLYTEASANFASHDHCNCQAYPLIKGAEPIDVKDYMKSSRYIEDDAARATANARVREWIADNL